MDGQAGQFGDPQSGLDGQDEQGVVASAEPGAAVGRGEQRVDLGSRVRKQTGPLAAFGAGWPAPAGSTAACSGCVQRGVAEQRVDRGQPGVAGAHAVAALGFQVGEERGDQRRRPGRRRPAGTGGLPVRCVREAQQQPQRVAVGGDGVRAGLALTASRSVKNACRVGASAVIDRGSPCCACSSRCGGQGQQFGGGLQVPVGGLRGRRARGRSTAAAAGPRRQRRRGTSPAGSPRRSCAAGRGSGDAPPAGAVIPAWSTSWANVVEHGGGDPPARLETKKLGPLGRGHNCGAVGHSRAARRRWWRAPARRALPNFASRIVTPASRSTSSSSRPTASPTRMPVTASNPNSAGRSRRAAAGAQRCRRQQP